MIYFVVVQADYFITLCNMSKAKVEIMKYLSKILIYRCHKVCAPEVHIKEAYTTYSYAQVMDTESMLIITHDD